MDEQKAERERRHERVEVSPALEREPSREGEPEKGARPETERLKSALADLETARKRAQGRNESHKQIEEVPADDRIRDFLALARERGVSSALAALGREKDPYVVDAVHDRLANMIRKGEINLDRPAK